MYKFVTFLVAVSLIVGGLSYLVMSNNFTVNSARIITNSPSATAHDFTPVGRVSPSQPPERIVSAELDIDVQIIAGGKDTTTNEWMLDTNNAFLAAETPTPILYGHNVSDIFAGLSMAGAGSEFDLQYDTYAHKYIYLATRFVDPDDVSILSERNNPNVVMLLTCSGVFNELRRIVYIQKIS